MGELFKKIFKGDAVIWAILGGLYLVSIVVMFSAISFSAYKAENHLGPFMGHLMHLGIGFVIILIFHRIPYTSMRFLLLTLVPLGALLLLILNFFIGNDVNNAVRSISLFGWEIQTIEPAKLAVVLLLSELIGHYSKVNKDNKKTQKKIFWSIVGILVVFCSLVAVQNLSTAALIFIIGFILMLIGGVSPKYTWGFFFGILLAGAVFIGGVKLLDIDHPVTRRVDTWIERVERHIGSVKEEDHTEIVINDDNRQIINSKIAIANGLYPAGPGNSVQRDFLPLAFSDFIYAVLIEEWSIVGGFIVILLYIVILSRVGAIARKCLPDSPNEALLSIGLALLICTQAFISMAVTVELGPVTGQPLPLISRGGMSILMTSFYFALLLSLSNKEKPVEPTLEQATVNGAAVSKEATEIQLKRNEDTPYVTEEINTTEEIES